MDPIPCFCQGVKRRSNWALKCQRTGATHGLLDPFFGRTLRSMLLPRDLYCFWIWETNTAPEVLTPALDAMRDEEVWWDRSDGTVPCNSQVGTVLYFFLRSSPGLNKSSIEVPHKKALSWVEMAHSCSIIYVGPATDNQFYISLLESPRWGTRPMQLTCFIILNCFIPDLNGALAGAKTDVFSLSRVSLCSLRLL